jgi:hypothetical protein
MYQKENWTVDAFAMYSVNGAAGGSNFSPTAYDTPDHDRQMNGIYSTYSGVENNKFDFYWLWSVEENRDATRQDGDRHTIGMRWAGSKPSGEGAWTWDVEGAYQFGKDNFGAGVDLDVHAGFVSTLAGYSFKSLPGSPAINGIFFWGSGDDNPADGKITTFHSLYPLGHAYWGLIDNFSGQNLLDFGIQSSVKPHKKVSLTSVFHWFHRANDNDAVYNIVGAPLAAGTPGGHIGNELDLVADFAATDNVSLQLGYFWFWYGDAITIGAPRPDASQFYAQTVIGF